MNSMETQVTDYFLSAEEILDIGRATAKEESPIDLSLRIMKEVRLGPLEWENFNVVPKFMKISNSGMTAVVSGKWQGPRPYLSKGPVHGRYVFSQLHFHWGRTFNEGSEHRINGQSLPLEAHVMFFKNVYENQDEAMKKTDGTVTVAYFFKVQRDDNVDLEPIIDSLPQITYPYSYYHMEAIPLQQFLPVFDEDYFMYWGSVYKMNVLWLICRQPIGISQNQLKLFRRLLDANHKPIEKNYRDPRSLNSRIVFHVNPSRSRKDILHPLPEQSTSYHQLDLSDAEGLKGRNLPSIDDILSQKGSISEVLNFNLLKAPCIADLKYSLANTLLQLEKRESNDCGVLENYIRAKFLKNQESEASKENGALQEGLSCVFQDHSMDLDRKSQSQRMNVIDEIYTPAQDEGNDLGNDLLKPEPLLPKSKEPSDKSMKHIKIEDVNSENEVNIPNVKKTPETSIVIGKNDEQVFSNFSVGSLHLPGEIGEEAERDTDVEEEVFLNKLKPLSRQSVSHVNQLSSGTQRKSSISRSASKSLAVISEEVVMAPPKKTVSFADYAEVRERESSNEVEMRPSNVWLDEDRMAQVRRKIHRKMVKVRREMNLIEKKSFFQSQENLPPPPPPSSPLANAQPKQIKHEASGQNSRIPTIQTSRFGPISQKASIEKSNPTLGFESLEQKSLHGTKKDKLIYSMGGHKLEADMRARSPASDTHFKSYTISSVEGAGEKTLPDLKSTPMLLDKTSARYRLQRHLEKMKRDYGHVKRPVQIIWKP